MATDVSSGDLRALVVPDPRFDLSRLVARGAGATQSAYTQQEDRSGPAEPDQASALVVKASGTLDEAKSIDVVTVRAGNPGPGGAGAFAWLETGGSTRYGWDGPSVITGWDALLTTGLSSWTTQVPAVVRTTSGKLLCLYTSSTVGGSSTIEGAVYSPSTGAWTGADLSLAEAYSPAAVALCALPTGRVLAFVRASQTDQVDLWATDHDGAAWEMISRLVLSTAAAAAITHMAAAYHDGAVLLLVGSSPSGNLDMDQYASDDGGAYCTRVLTGWRSTLSEDPQVAAVVVPPSGGFLLAYHDNDAGTPTYRCRAIGTAFQPASEVAAVTVLDGGGLGGGAYSPACSAYVDEDGSVVAVLGDARNNENVVLRRTFDGGATWATLAAGVYHSGSANAHLHTWGAASIQGRVAVVSRWASATSAGDPYSVVVLWLGGYSSHTAPALAGHLASARRYDDTDWCGYASGETGESYLPIEEPQNIGWTAAGAGAEALVSEGLEITTTANTRYYERTEYGLGMRGYSVFAEFQVELDVGSGSKVADQVCFLLCAGDGATWSAEAKIRLDDSGWELFDTAAAGIGVGVNASLTSMTRIRIAIDSGRNVRTWYATPAHAASWTEGPQGTLTAAAAASPRVRWGHTGSASDVSRWALVGVAWQVGRWAPTSTKAEAAMASAWTAALDLRGRQWPVLPMLVTAGLRVHAADGPTLLGDQWTIGGDATHPIRMVLPSVEPSPRVTWRSEADEVEQLIVWDIGDSSGGRLMGTSPVLALLGTNLRTAYLEYYDGAAWQTVLTVDAAAGFTSCPYRRDGDIVYVDTGSASSSPWRSYGALRGGTIQMDATTRRKISDQVDGVWEDAATKRMALRIDLQGGEPTSGTAVLWHREAVAYRHEQSIDARYWRVRIPSQITVAGYYEVGQIVVGSLAVIGHPYQYGWSVTREAQVDERRWADGQSRYRRSAPSQRRLEVQWSEPVDATALFGDTSAPDYVSGSAAGLPLAARRDGPRMLDGILDALDGPRNPVLWLPRVVRATGNQQGSGREALLWARLGASLSRDNVRGDELVSEVERTGRLTLTEVV